MNHRRCYTLRWSLYLPVSMEINAGHLAFLPPPPPAAGSREEMEARTDYGRCHPRRKPVLFEPLGANASLDAFQRFPWSVDMLHNNIKIRPS